MDLKFIGLGACFNPLLDNSNAYFTVNNNLYLVDCGESAYLSYWKLDELKTCDSITVAITHLHADHCGSLGSLISYCFYVLKKKITVYHPLKTIVQLLDLMGIEKDCYTWISEFPKSNDVSFEPVEVKHVDNMQCYGYIIKTDTFKVYTSGDAANIPEQIVEMLYSGELDRIYQDTALEEDHATTHCSIVKMEKAFKPEIRHKVFCIHLDIDNRELVKSKGFSLPDGFDISEA